MKFKNFCEFEHFPKLCAVKIWSYTVIIVPQTEGENGWFRTTLVQLRDMLTSEVGLVLKFHIRIEEKPAVIIVSKSKFSV